MSSAWWWPFVVLAVSVLFIIVAISWWRLHAFIALLLASLLAGMLASRDSWVVVAKDGKEVIYSHWVGVVELIAKGLGDTARDIAISIALASVIGMCLMERCSRQSGSPVSENLWGEASWLGAAVVHLHSQYSYLF